MTFELKTLLNDNIDNEIGNAFFNDDFPTEDEHLEWSSQEVVEFYNLLNKENVKVQAEDSYGGEGQGDDFWSVYSFTKGDEKFYIKFDGWYQSYNGSEFTKWFFVEPKEETVTKFYKV